MGAGDRREYGVEKDLAGGGSGVNMLDEHLALGLEPGRKLGPVGVNRPWNSDLPQVLDAAIRAINGDEH